MFQSSSVWIPPLFPSKLQIKKQQQKKKQTSYTAELTFTSLQLKLLSWQLPSVRTLSTMLLQKIYCYVCSIAFYFLVVIKATVGSCRKNNMGRQKSKLRISILLLLPECCRKQKRETWSEVSRKKLYICGELTCNCCTYHAHFCRNKPQNFAFTPKLQWWQS